MWKSKERTGAPSGPHHHLTCALPCTDPPKADTLEKLRYKHKFGNINGPHPQNRSLMEASTFSRHLLLELVNGVGVGGTEANSKRANGSRVPENQNKCPFVRVRAGDSRLH
ncbi:hypothetical protein Q8A73_021725 [Channa argus]|nr:hypothetical protein Q8A73_021725 [Channa argus]